MKKGGHRQLFQELREIPAAAIASSADAVVGALRARESFLLFGRAPFASAPTCFSGSQENNIPARPGARPKPSIEPAKKTNPTPIES